MYSISEFSTIFIYFEKVPFKTSFLLYYGDGLPDDVLKDVLFWALKIWFPALFNFIGVKLPMNSFSQAHWIFFLLTWIFQPYFHIAYIQQCSR